ncbi:MAG: sigma-B regulation protein RsbU (phosphoserine phosphatase) [Gammaproteobacteria bacterium]|jgi:sigma-B regulation protein RsbU (phosphoserine phosphatase)
MMKDAQVQETFLMQTGAAINKPYSSSPQDITILIVEDSKSEQIHMQAMLTKFGYHVTTADNGRQALNILKTQKIQLIISDWRMPELTGIDLCRQVRADSSFGHPYIIMVTGRTSKDDLIAGMEAGADDFISKPFNSEELRVRLQAGTRILQLRDAAEQRNMALEQALRREAKTSLLIQRDLEAAARMQQMQLPDNVSPFAQLEIDSLFLPAATVAGDSFNYFPLDDQHLAFYVLDVAGHGIASAMLSFTVSHFLAPGMGIIPSPNLRPLKVSSPYKNPSRPFAQPEQVVSDLNQRFIEKEDCTHYFTMIYGILNVNTGKGRLCQAGHPHPLIVSGTGGVRKLGNGGFPVGMLRDASYNSVDFKINEGERLFLYSDGITDSKNGEGVAFSANRLATLLKVSKGRCLPDVINLIDTQLKRWHCDAPLDDDISLLSIGRKSCTDLDRIDGDI